MTNREKIVWLKRYTSLDRRINNKIERCEALRKQLGKITTTLGTQPGGGGSIYKTKDPDIILKIVDLVAQMEQEVNQLIDCRQEIKEAVDAVVDPRERELLEYRYLNDWTFERIAVNIGYCWKQTHRLHSQALNNIKIMEK